MLYVVNPTDSDERTEEGSLGNTRRQFMVGAAGAVGGVAAGSALIGPAAGQAEEDEEDEAVENDFEDDVEILNYALTIEYLQASFYEEGLSNIDEEDFYTLVAPDDSRLQEDLLGQIQTIQSQKNETVSALTSAIESLGGTPAEEPTFDFGIAVQYPMAFLGTGAQFADISVSAYAGAAPDIEDEAVLAPALGIHSATARHASYLRTLIDETGFPNAIDEPRSRDEVLDLVSEYIVEAEEEAEDGEDTNETDTNETDVDNATEEPADNVTEEPADNVTEEPVDNVTEEPVDNVTDGTDNVTDGNVTNGNATNGNATNGNVTNGNATNGT